MSKIIEKARVVFWEYETSRGLKEATIKRKIRELERFIKYLKSIDKEDLRDVEAKEIEKYFLYLTDELDFSVSTLNTTRSMLVDLFMALWKNELILTNPMSMTDIVLREKSGAKVILTENEMARFLDCIDTNTGYGVRDKATFELMYITGMRIGEVVKLEVEDIDFSLNEVMIRQGKGSKDRIVPFGSVCREWLWKWIKEARQWFVKSDDVRGVFLNEKGQPISASTIRHRFKKYLELAGIDKKGITLHSIRHSCATHLLQNGADIVFVAELLGHESLETTCIYTREIINNLKKAHKMYHPRENSLYKEEV